MVNQPHKPTPQQRILTAALHEFATHGYEAASTNAIATRAKVAKGLVFHYFEDKDQLFIKVFDVEVRRFTERVFAFADPLPSDLFERLLQLTTHKLQIGQQHPHMVDFLLVALTETPPRVRAQLMKRQAALTMTFWPRFVEGIDGSRLRKGLKIADAIETLTVLSDGLEKQLSAQLRSHTATLEQVTRIAWKHYARLRDGLYRPN